MLMRELTAGKEPPTSAAQVGDLATGDVRFALRRPARSGRRRLPAARPRIEDAMSARILLVVTNAVVDGRLVTGHNLGSAKETATKVAELL